jgi:uncharacterized phage protein gp47/JayE
MNFNLPKSAKEVDDRITSDVVARLPDAGSFLKVSFFKALITGFALRIYDIYRKIPIMVRQFFVQTAQGEFLFELGNQFGITRNLAVGSRGRIVLVGDAGIIVPNNTLFNNAAGLVYEGESDTTISQKTVSVDSISRVGTTVTVNFINDHNLASGVVIDSITGATPADFNASNVQITVTSAKQFIFTQEGTSGGATGDIIAQWTNAVLIVGSQTQGQQTNMLAGSILNLSSPIAGVSNSAYVGFGEISGGTDIENIEDYRQRILFSLKNPKTIFNNTDIINKVKTVAGVTRAWVFNPDSVGGGFNPSSITRNGQVATVTKTNHGLVNGNFISASGAEQDGYNTARKPILKINDDNFVYIVEGEPDSPATGTISIAFSYVELGQVRVGFVRDNDNDQIPSLNEVNDVKNALLEIKPAFMAEQDIIVFAPTPVSVDFTFSFISPSSVQMQEAIQSALKDFFKIYNNINQDIRLSDINGVLTQIIDSGGNNLKYTLASPNTDIEIVLNEIAVLGNITFA